MGTISSLINASPGAIAQGLIWGIMALGVFITFKILDVADLTVDGTLSLGGGVCVMLIRSGMPVPTAILIATLSGLVAGFMTGFFYTKCKIPVILAGILTQLSLYSINLRVMQGKANQPVSIDKYDLLVSQRFVYELNMKNPIFVLLIGVIIIVTILYIFFGTEFGNAIRATGDNKNMSRAQGINTDKMIIIGLMLSNAMVALSGALLSQYQGANDVNMGRGAIVIGLAACIIGEALIGKHFKNFSIKLFAVVIGAIIYYLVLQLVLNFGLNTNDLKLFTALFVAFFLSMPVFINNFKLGGKS